MGRQLQRPVAEGDVVVGTVRSEAVALSHLGGELKILAFDLADEASVISAFHQAFEVSGRLDVIVINAGYGLLGAVEHSTDEELRDLFDVNVFAPVRITRTALGYPITLWGRQ